ncbi:hypothetical protein BDN72DRAFT_762649 [Pluteus cervinus]|uniref:Uncharacterized protein n=1 Tax=Pluteus cervinus TaxID=181527 RepID=A0ACD3B4Z1_9AGAR|nr:hypothetical protein BDN72DRAFT_762649 [Pluteus cervinus]
MPPKRTRDQLVRQAQAANLAISPDVIAKRTKRHLEELEARNIRSNYAEPALLNAADDEESAAQGKYSKGRARHTISDKRSLKISGTSAAAKKKKSTMSVRTALLYRKNLGTLVDESNISSLPVATYLTAQTCAPKYPARPICSVCGYWGSYRCQKCGVGYCDKQCEGVHDETRCERRVV